MTQASTHWRGELVVGDGWAHWRGAAGDNSLHRHLAAQAVIGERPLSVVLPDGGVVTGRVILIDPLVPHRLERAASVDVLFLEPAADHGGADALLRRFPLDEPDAVRIEAHAPRLRFWGRARSDLGRRSGPSEALRRALARVQADLPNGPVPLASAAAAADLSSDRFRHLFVDTMGLPFRRYVLWIRLQRAVALLGEGEDATTAAHGAGFADSAHLARTIRAMLGVSASQLMAAR